MLIYLLTSTIKYTFKKFTHSHDLAVTMRSYKAVNMDLNEAFKTALQTNVKTAKLLLSSGELNLNDFQDSKGNSHLMNILESKNTSLLKSYFNKVRKESDAKLENSSISEAFSIALNLNDKKIVSIFLKGLTKLNALDQLQTQSLNHNFPDKAKEFPTAPPAYSEIDDSLQHLYPILGDATHVN